MKPLPEEEMLEKIFTIIKQASPKLLVPGPGDVQFFNSSRVLGRGGPHYGVDFNIARYNNNLSINNEDLVDTVCHEVIHFNGIMGHGPTFVKALKILLEKVNKTIRRREDGIT